MESDHMQFFSAPTLHYSKCSLVGNDKPFKTNLGSIYFLNCRLLVGCRIDNFSNVFYFHSTVVIIDPVT